MVEFILARSDGKIERILKSEFDAKQRAVTIHNDDPEISVIVYKVFKSGKRKEVFSK